MKEVMTKFGSNICVRQGVHICKSGALDNLYALDAMLARYVLSCVCSSDRPPICVCHMSKFYKMPRQFEMVLGMEASLHLSYTVSY